MDEMILRERTRGDCYRFLSACFCQPGKNVFQEDSILKYGNEELLVEYSRLFIGPFGVIAPPYGSVYLDGERRVMGDSTMKVIGMYRDEGLSGPSDATALPDHGAGG